MTDYRGTIRRPRQDWIDAGFNMTNVFEVTTRYPDGSLVQLLNCDNCDHFSDEISHDDDLGVGICAVCWELPEIEAQREDAIASAEGDAQHDARVEDSL